jgi:hypothetical protein
VDYRPGTALLYRMDTFHRGTPVRPGASRVTGHYVIKRASADWMGSNSFLHALTALPPAFLAGLDVRQRAALRFPPPGHAYCPGLSGGVEAPVAFSKVNRFCMVLVYELAGRRTAQTGGFRPGQGARRPWRTSASGTLAWTWPRTPRASTGPRGFSGSACAAPAAHREAPATRHPDENKRELF